jgi:hypothetical protein
MVKISETELEKLIQGEETNTVELKVAAPRAVEMAERLCGKANAQDIVHIACPSPLFVGYSGHARDFEVGPLQHHRERAHIVQIAANVRIEMDFRHSTSLMSRDAAVN